MPQKVYCHVFFKFYVVNLKHTKKRGLFYKRLGTLFAVCHTVYKALIHIDKYNKLKVDIYLVYVILSMIIGCTLFEYNTVLLNACSIGNAERLFNHVYQLEVAYHSAWSSIWIKPLAFLVSYDGFHNVHSYTNVYYSTIKGVVCDI